MNKNDDPTENRGKAWPGISQKRKHKSQCKPERYLISLVIREI